MSQFLEKALPNAVFKSHAPKSLQPCFISIFRYAASSYLNTPFHYTTTLTLSSTVCISLFHIRGS